MKRFLKISSLVLAGLFLFSALALGRSTPRSLPDILARIDLMEQETYMRWCREAGVIYPPDCVVLQVFKREMTTRIWAGNSDKDSQLRLVQEIPVCALGFCPGPKRTQGDSRTPEGFFTAVFHGWSRYSYMWIDLDDLDQPGQQNKGSAFRMCLDYPNAYDGHLSRQAGHSRTGGDICIHGNCISDGCISYNNRDFLPVFAFAMHHDESRHGPLQVHIFPFDFGKESELGQTQGPWWRNVGCSFTGRGREETGEELALFQANLERGWKTFENTRRPLNYFIAPASFKKGDKSFFVRQIQEALCKRGFYKGASGETFSGSLDDAVRAFQRQMGLAVDGVAGPATQRALGLGLAPGYVFDGDPALPALSCLGR